MTPQEQDLIQNVANKLKASPNKPKDADADRLIAKEIASQEDIVYKLTQAVLVQEMALKNLKAQNEFLETQVSHYKTESERGAFSRMMGGAKPAPMAPAPMQQPSAFGSFMQTAAGVAAGMVAGHLITEALFGDEEPAAEAPATETTAADTPTEATTPEATPAEAATASETTAAPEAAASTPEVAPAEDAASFLGQDSDFASEYAVADTNFAEELTTFDDFGTDIGSFEEDFEGEDL